MAGQRYTLIFDANLDVTQIKGALNQIQTNLNTLHLPQNIAKGLQGSFDNLKKEVQSFEAIMNKDITGKTDFNKLENQANKVATAYEKLKIQVKNLTSLSSRDIERLFPETVSKNIDQATTALKNYQANMAKAKRDVADAAAQVAKFQQKIQEVSNKTPLTNDEWKQLKTDIANAEQEVAKYKAAIQDAQQRAAAVEARTPNYKKSLTWREAQQDIQKYTTALQNAEREVQRLNGVQQNSITYTKQNQQLTELNTKLADAKNNYAQLEQALKLLESTGNGGGLKVLLDEIGRITGLDMSKFKSDLTGVGDALQTYFTQAANNAATGVNNLGNATRSAEQPMASLGAKVRDTGAQISTMDSQIRDVQALKTRIQYFFGLNNAINLGRRAIRSAINTIKELDKAMTETAVVTNFSVSDMWAQLPEYTKRANELGVTTLAAYQAATLYYQQGLKTNEVNALSVETLKMARIAGLDAAEATDRMTNALRGFNMELTTANAQRVDDVYSELAANTASNVDEISTAMTKVASLAHNANMEFETTAAFLAQIIETTRESAETAGTALKTVIARFSEVKKLVNEGTLRGQDEEGQIIDVNKVSAALRTAGIDMNKYFLGEVGLDDIFIELASKWDSLTALQQRYIATQAAGSRQQSRFIALMSDYARTQELVGKAYKANGASARQFEKTQESLESKLARLKNAWNEFLMGLSNNVVVKGAVDFLTDLLNLINKLTSAFGDGVGTLAKWGVVAAGIFGGRALLATGGLVDRALVGLLGSTGIGNALTGAGVIGGTRIKRGPVQGPPTASGQMPRRATFFGNIGAAGKSAWGGLQTLGLSLKKGSGGIKGVKAALAAPGGEALLQGASGTAAGFAGLATVLGAVAAAAAVAYGAYKLWENYTPEGQLKVATKVADAMSDVAENAQKAASKIRDVAENAKKYQSAIDDATSVSNREKAIQDQNEYILSLLKEDATYAQYIQSTFTEGGQLYLTLDSDALAAAVDKIAEGAVRASAYSGFTNAVQQKKNADVYKSHLYGVDLANRTIQTGYDPEGNLEYRSLTDQEFFKYSNYQAQIDAANIAMRNYATTAASQLISLENTNLDSELNTLVASVIGKTFNADDILKQALNTKRGNWWEGEATDEKIRAEYSRLYGSDLEKKYDKSDAEYAIALGQVLEEEIGTQLPVLLNTVRDANGKMLLEVISGSYEGNITNDQLKTAFDALNNKQKESIEELLGVSADAIYDALNQQATELKSAQNEFRKKAVATLKKSGLDNIKQLDQITNQLTISQEKKLVEIADSLSNYGTDFSGIILDKISTAMLEGDYNDTLESFATSLSDNPILTLQALKDAAESTDPVLQKIVKTLGLINKNKQFDTSNFDAFSKENLVQYFLISDAFDDLTEKIEKFREENGQLNAYNIKELANESNTLAILLNEDIISANGLANAINALQEGNITVSDLNENVLQLFDSFDSVGNAVQRAGQFIKDFDLGEDWGDAFDFIDNAIEKMTELVENRELGNPQLHNYWKAFFTTDPQDLADWEAGIALIKQLQGDGGANFWTDIIGFSMDETGNIADMGLEGFANSQFNNYSEYIKSLAEGNGFSNFSDEYYDLMIRNAANHDYGFLKDIAAVEIQKIVEAYGEGLESGAPTKADIQAIADAYGLDPQEILDAWVEKFNNGEALDFSQLENQIRETVTTISSLYSKYTDEFAKQNLDRNASNFFKLLGADANGNFNIDSLKVKIGQIVPEVADGSVSVEDWFEEQVAASGGSVKLPVEYQTTQKLEDGTFETTTIQTEVEVTNLAEYEQAVQQIQNAADTEILGSSLVNAFTDAQTQAEALSQFISKLGETTSLSNVQAEITTCTNDAETLNKELAKTINKSLNIVPLQSTVAITDGITTVTLAISAFAKGGKIGSYASGNKPGMALTGEEAPEIVWNKEKGYAYLTGADGPEIQNLQPGDKIFNGNQTQQILKRSGLKSFANGTIKSYEAGTIWKKEDILAGSSSSDSDSDKYQKQSTWRNELDWLYDLMEDIAEYERQQNIIQTRNELALEDIASSGRDLYELTREELTNLETQLDGQQAAQLKRLQQMGELQTQVNAASYGRYMQWNQQDRTLEIDWDAIEAIQDKETYDEVTDWLNRMESVQDQIDDAEDAMWDIKKQIQELQERYLQKYLDFQNRVLEAIVKQYQDQIDKLSEINDNVNDTNASILDSIQREIDLERQIRDNTDAESDIADMEARLAYLQRDTTGANATEIRQLQEQLDEARKNYGDTLIDQAVDRLAQSNEDAAAQREKQIELMQAQLDYWQESGGLWSEVEQLMSTGFNGNGSLIRGSDLEKVLQNAENYEAMSQAQRDNWANELILETNQVGAHILELANGMNVNAEQIRALLASLIEQLGGTPEHSYTAEKAEEKYATGGLNTYTGLAHLDGTPSAPEYVLNPEQTNAFLRLADVLPSIMSGDSIGGTTYGGDIYLNLSMHVDEIASDYDVDRIADRVKDILYDASSYRNVNTLNFIR